MTAVSLFVNNVIEDKNDVVIEVRQVQVGVGQGLTIVSFKVQQVSTYPGSQKSERGCDLKRLRND